MKTYTTLKYGAAFVVTGMVIGGATIYQINNQRKIAVAAEMIEIYQASIEHWMAVAYTSSVSVVTQSVCVWVPDLRATYRLNTTNGWVTTNYLTHSNITIVTSNITLLSPCTEPEVAGTWYDTSIGRALAFSFPTNPLLRDYYAEYSYTGSIFALGGTPTIKFYLGLQQTNGIRWDPALRYQTNLTFAADKNGAAIRVLTQVNNDDLALSYYELPTGSLTFLAEVYQGGTYLGYYQGDCVSYYGAYTPSVFYAFLYAGYSFTNMPFFTGLSPITNELDLSYRHVLASLPVDSDLYRNHVAWGANAPGLPANNLITNQVVAAPDKNLITPAAYNDFLTAIENSLPSLMGYYLRPPPTTNDGWSIYTSVTGLFADLQIGDCTSKFTRVPAGAVGGPKYDGEFTMRYTNALMEMYKVFYTLSNSWAWVNATSVWYSRRGWGSDTNLAASRQEAETMLLTAPYGQTNWPGAEAYCGHWARQRGGDTELMHSKIDWYWATSSILTSMTVKSSALIIHPRVMYSWFGTNYVYDGNNIISNIPVTSAGSNDTSLWYPDGWIEVDSEPGLTNHFLLSTFDTDIPNWPEDLSAGNTAFRGFAITRGESKIRISWGFSYCTNKFW